MGQQIELTPVQQQKLAALLKGEQPPDGWGARPYENHLGKVLYALQHGYLLYLDARDAAALDRLYPGIVAITRSDPNADLPAGVGYGREAARP